MLCLNIIIKARILSHQFIHLEPEKKQALPKLNLAIEAFFLFLNGEVKTKPMSLLSYIITRSFLIGRKGASQ